MATNRRRDPGPSSGDCCLCSQPVYPPGAVILFGTDGCGKTVWHQQCATQAAQELSTLSERAMVRERLVSE